MVKESENRGVPTSASLITVFFRMNHKFLRFWVFFVLSTEIHQSSNEHLLLRPNETYPGVETRFLFSTYGLPLS